MLSFRSRLLAAVFTATLVAAPVQVQAREPAALASASSPEAVGFSSARLKRLDEAMAKVVADGRVAGMSTLLMRHGKVVSFNTYGKASLETGAPMSKDTIFRIYSMSKPVTGVALMILFEEGRWRLDDPITKFLPELEGLKVMEIGEDGQQKLVPVSRPPTMRELVSHTAGFGYGLSDKHPVDLMFREQRVLGSNGLEEMTQKVATIPLMFQPGTQWYYSVAVDLQGRIVEKISGQTLGQFLDQRLFQPLKMKDTAFSVPADKASRLAAVYVANPQTGKIEEAKVLIENPIQDFTKPPSMESGGGGLVSTATDYARFAQMIVNGGVLDGERILSPASVELMGTNMIPDQVLVTSNGTTGSRFNEAVGFGLDFAVVMDPRKAGSLEGEGSLSWGGAAGTWFWADPENDVVFVGMIQRFGGSGGDDLGTLSRTLVYQALVDPAK
jgi:CubicO group peptidase (beta-lactamase class C family)